MSDAMQFLVVVVGAYLVLLLGRAMAARLAGPQNAEMVLNFVPFPFSILTDLLNALPRSRQMDDDQSNEPETVNTETLGNAGNTVGNTAEPQFMTVTDLGMQKIVPRMTREEHAELLNARHDAIVMLDRCVKYYRDSQSEDDGTIPRYDKISMKAEHRGAIVDMLVYSGAVSKIPNKRTFVIPEIGTCAMLMKLIIDSRLRVYPVGYAERKQALLDSAVQAIPENVHG